MNEKHIVLKMMGVKLS